MDDYLKIVLPDKLRLDQLYVRNHRFLSDLDILFWTLIVLLPRLREHKVPMESFYNGLLSRFSKRFFNWFVADCLVAFLAIGVAGVFWRLGGPLNLGLTNAIWIAAGMALFFGFINSCLGLGRVWWRYAKPVYTLNLAFSSGISTLLMGGLNYLWPVLGSLPLRMFYLVGLLAFLGFTAVRYRERLLIAPARNWAASRRGTGQIGERILVVGAGECGLLATWLLRRSKLSFAFSVVGMVDDDPTKEGMLMDGHRVFGLTRRIPEIVRQQDVGVILFAIESIQAEDQARI